MIRPGETIRRVIDLLAAERLPGARLVCHQKWQLNQENQWYEYEVLLEGGQRLPVEARIAVVAERKGLVKVQRHD
jgi:hypothetical protein